MKYHFDHGKELLQLCKSEHMPVSGIMLGSEEEQSGRSRESILEELKGHLKVMRESVQGGLNPDGKIRGMLSGNNAVKLMAYAPSSNMGEHMAKAAAAAMAVTEVNASMGKIVAAPTAGASGILPAVLLVCGKQQGFTEEALCRGLLTAGAIGCIIAKNAGIAGASGGCQAETGSAAAMAAGALTELCGGSPEMVLHASAIALKNVMGLVCDPVGGLVECPCIKRNAAGTVNAILSCDMALAGIESLIPFDEVVAAMKSVGNQMHEDLRETARGGLAATETARKISAELERGCFPENPHRKEKK